MLLLQKLLGRGAALRRPGLLTDLAGNSLADGPTDLDASGYADQGLQAEYYNHISVQLERWGVPESCATLQVRQVGTSDDGRDIYLGLIRMVAWDRDASLRLLLGMPLLEKKVRTRMRGFWWAEVSHFAGLWLHPEETVHSPATELELRQLISTLTQPSIGVRRKGLPAGPGPA